MDKFQNKHVFITGASAGIGAALAHEFASQGARLTLTARRLHLLEGLAQDLIARGTEVLVETCDVTQDGDLERALEKARERFGKVDVVVANAGFGVVGKLENLKLEDYRRQFETNVFGVLRTIQCSLEDLKQTRGSLVLLGSVAGYISLPNASPYAMSKFAIRALADSLWAELAPYGIAVTLISPGFVESSIRKVDNQGVFQRASEDPMPPWLLMPASRAARDIVRAVSRRRRERIVTFHGKIFVTLFRFFPWLIRLITRFGIKGRNEPSSPAQT